MGETAADTRREIEEIRKDVSSAVGELKRRVLRAVSPQTYLEFAKDNPAAVVGIGLAGVSLAGVSFARSLAESRRQNRPAERLKRNVLEAANEVTGAYSGRWRRCRLCPLRSVLARRMQKARTRNSSR